MTKKTFIFHFKILSKAWHVFEEKIEIDNNNYSFALDTALGKISNNYTCPLNITLENLQVKIEEN